MPGVRHRVVRGGQVLQELRAEGRRGPGAHRGRPGSPGVLHPKHLAEKILTSKAALEDERKQVTVLFADLKGAMEQLADDGGHRPWPQQLLAAL